MSDQGTSDDEGIKDSVIHAFVGTLPTGELILWGFPECQQHETLLENIQKREAKIKLSIDEANSMDESL